MNREKALELAGAFLGEEYPETPPTIVMRPELTREHGWAWEVHFDTREWMEDRNPKYRMMITLLVVPMDGSGVHFMPSAFTTDEAEAYLASGRWPER